MTPMSVSIAAIQEVANTDTGKCGDSPLVGVVVDITCAISGIDTHGFYW